MYVEPYEIELMKQYGYDITRMGPDKFIYKREPGITKFIDKFEYFDGDLYCHFKYHDTLALSRKMSEDNEWHGLTINLVNYPKQRVDYHLLVDPDNGSEISERLTNYMSSNEHVFTMVELPNSYHDDVIYRLNHSRVYYNNNNILLILNSSCGTSLLMFVDRTPYLIVQNASGVYPLDKYNTISIHEDTAKIGRFEYNPLISNVVIEY